MNLMQKIIILSIIINNKNKEIIKKYWNKMLQIIQF